MYHKSHPFKEYSLVGFCTLTEIYNHHHYLIIGYSTYPKKEPCIHQQSLSFPGATNLLSLSMDLPILDISYNRTPIISSLLCLASFIQYVSQGLSVLYQVTVFHYFSWLNNIPLYGYITFVYLHQFLNIFKFIYGCAGSSLLSLVFLQLWQVGAALCCGVQASHCGGFSYCGTLALGKWASVVEAHGLSTCDAWA